MISSLSAHNKFVYQNGNEETALKLERVLGSTAAFWLRYEAQYRAALARIEEER